MKLLVPSSFLFLVAFTTRWIEHDDDGFCLFVESKSPSRSSSTSHGRRPSSKQSPRRRMYDEDEDDFDDDEDVDDEDEMNFGFPDDEEEEEEEEFDEEEDDVLPSARSKRPSKNSSSRRSPASSQKPQRKPRKTQSRSGAPPTSKRRYEDFDDDEEFDDFEDETDHRNRRPSHHSGRQGRSSPPPSSRARGGSTARPRSMAAPRKSSSSRRGSSSRYDDRYDSRGGRRGGRDVVPYGRRSSSSSSATFTRGLAALRESMPDPSSVRDAAMQAAAAARETTNKLSTTVYREIKGLTSSELEQVMLKATRPDDAPVKGKHVERLVGVTYQISGRYDIYDAVLRKLWAKMSEKDWRTTIKAIYVLHRFSADGAPEHQAALKARLRELRRTRDPKRKDKYFNSKQLLAGDATPETMKYRAFLARYAHYVLLRAQCFGGTFNEISQEAPSSSKSKPQKKAMTSTSLRSEHLDASRMILKAGCACGLKDGEECENTAIAVERVASDLIGLTTAVATALNRVLKQQQISQKEDLELIRLWCEFYANDLLPQTKSMVKKTSVKLDAYGLFLSSRMGASVPQELLQKGLKGPDEGDNETSEKDGAEGEEEEEEGSVTEAKKTTGTGETAEAEEEDDDDDSGGVKTEDDAAEEEEEEDEEEEEGDDEAPEDEETGDNDDEDEYDYEEEEYYDEEG